MQRVGLRSSWEISLICYALNHNQLFPESPPLFFRIIVAILGFVAVAACAWNFTVGRRLAINLKAFSENLRVENSKVMLPHTLKITPGKLTLRTERHRSGEKAHFRTHALLNYTGETKETSEVDVSNVEGDVGGIGGVVGRAYPELVTLPVFEVSEPGYKTAGGSVVLCIVPKLTHEVVINRGSLSASYNHDFVQLTVSAAQDTIRGKITYTKPFNGASRSARVELEARYKRPKIWVGTTDGVVLTY